MWNKPFARLLGFLNPPDPTNPSGAPDRESGRPSASGGLPILAAEADPLGDVPRYPPFDTGIPLISTEHVIRSQRELIERIFRACGMSREEHSRLVTPVIENLAAYVHLLPATNTLHHKGAGGLFRFALEIGLHAMQHANGAVFPISGGIERRHFTQPKWALATLLAGMCSQIYRPICTMTVLTRDGRQWAALLTPLHAWGTSLGANRYFIRWHDDSERQAGVQGSAAYLVSKIIPAEVLQHLAQDNHDIVPAMTAAITGAEGYGAGNPIARILGPLTTRVIDEDLKSAPQNYGHLSLGLHLEPHLIDAMRLLVRTAWSINKGDSVVLAGAEGVFLVWPTAAANIVALMTRDHFAGVPKHPDTLAEMLCAAGVFERNPAQGPYWSVIRPDSMEAVDDAVRLSSAALILPKDQDLQPYAQIRLMLASENKAAAPSAPAAAAPAEAARASKPQAGKAKTKEAHLQPQLFEAGESDGATAVEPAVVPAGEAAPAQASARKSPPPEQGADRLLAALKPDTAAMLRGILANRMSGTLTGIVAAVPKGVGISHDEVSAHGVHVATAIDDLSARQWLWMDPTKPQRKIHTVEHLGQDYKMVIIRRDIALAIGLLDEGTCAAAKQG